MSELNIKTLVKEINRMRDEEIKYQNQLDKDDLQWFYIEGRISSLTNVLFYYFAKVSDLNV